MSQAVPQLQNQLAIRQIPFMGVIEVVEQAKKLGYDPLDPFWSNLGQGQPEVGPLAGAPERWEDFSILPEDHAYGPVEGLPELREAVAEHYNRLYRPGKSSKYTADNVVIAAGGRTILTRLAATFEGKLGYFVPDYSAYEDLLNTFTRATPVEISLKASEGFSISTQELKRRVQQDQLQALLISNPCNPTGHVIKGESLQAWVDLAREQSCVMFLDEFYSHYIYEDENPGAGPVSATSLVGDVNQDPVLIVDGLTKNFRYPGWRLGWVLGPQDIMRNLTAAGSFIDGGPARPIQRAALKVLEASRADQETTAVRHVFSEKRNLTLNRLQAMGITFPVKPGGTFYAFGSVADLPAPLNDGYAFFQKALQYQVLTVPGIFFDINPLKQKKDKSALKSFVRFSYGPPRDNLIRGLDRLEKMIKENS